MLSKYFVHFCSESWLTLEGFGGIHVIITQAYNTFSDSPESWVIQKSKTKYSCAKQSKYFGKKRDFTIIIGGFTEFMFKSKLLSIKLSNLANHRLF